MSLGLIGYSIQFGTMWHLSAKRMYRLQSQLNCTVLGTLCFMNAVLEKHSAIDTQCSANNVLSQSGSMFISNCCFKISGECLRQYKDALIEASEHVREPSLFRLGEYGQVFGLLRQQIGNYWFQCSMTGFFQGDRDAFLFCSADSLRMKPASSARSSCCEIAPALTQSSLS